MISDKLKDYVKNVDELVEEYGCSYDYANAYYQAARVCEVEDNDVASALEISAKAKKVLDELIFNMVEADFFALNNYCNEKGIEVKENSLYWSLLHLEAPHLFDSYLLYLEKNREFKEQFYLPKRKQLLKHGIIGALQKLEDDELDILSISMPPGTGKTTIEKFFASWVIGRHPDDYNLFFSHSDDITRMFYDGVLSMVVDKEYTWTEIFPGIKLRKTDASRQQFDMGKNKPFWSLQNTSIGSKNAGKVRCNRYLFCDDLIGGIEEALNINMLDKLWRIYGTDARQRKLNESVKELHIATRWSVHDVIGRLKEMYDGSNRALFLAIPDIDENTGESNFDYDYNGMSAKFFNDQALAMDEVTYRCLYKNEPIEREGLLYHEDDLRRFLDMPMQEPDAIWGICDTKAKGTDFLFLPCAYQYEQDFYIVDCVCTDSSDYGVQYERMSDLIVLHNMQQCEFESNSGGDRVALEVQKLVDSKGGRCHITTKPTETNKETRIIVNADWVKKHCLFKSKESYTIHDDYGIMMKWLLSYTVAGKNAHDDIPDGFANLAMFVTKGNRVAKVEAIVNPFRTGSSNYYGGY